MNPKHDKSIRLELAKLIFKGKYQSVGRGVNESLYFPDLKSYNVSVHRTVRNRKLAVFSKGNDNMPFCHYVGLIKAVRLIRGYLKKQSIIE
jgi:hypothetical protein